MKIAGRNYRLKMVNDLEGDKGNALSGHIDYNRGLIELEANQNRRSQQETFMHEILHGILNHSGAAYFISKNSSKEGVIDAIANELTNLGVSRFLMDKHFPRSNGRQAS